MMNSEGKCNDMENEEEEEEMIEEDICDDG